MVFALLLSAQQGFKLGYKQLISCLFELEMFQKKLTRIPTERAFSNAFDKLPLDILSTLCSETHYQEFKDSGSRFHGLKVIIPDGTKISLPKSQSVLDKFGEGQGHYPQCLALGFFELSSGTFEDFKIDHMNTAERKLFLNHVFDQSEQALYVADAGFNGMAVLARAIEYGQQVLCPMSKNKMMRSMKSSKKRSKIIEVKLTRVHLKNHPTHLHLLGEIIKVRLIRTRGTTKLESQVLVTTLIDENIFKWKELCELYRQRYTIEVAFRHLKVHLKLEAIRKRKLSKIIKSIHAAVALYNLSSLLRNCFDVPGLIPQKYGVKKFCFSFCLDRIIIFCKAIIKPTRGIKKQMNNCLKAIKNCWFVYKPWRMSPRICFTPLSKFSTRNLGDQNQIKRLAEMLEKEFQILGKEYGQLRA